MNQFERYGGNNHHKNPDWKELWYVVRFMGLCAMIILLVAALGWWAR